MILSFVISYLDITIVVSYMMFCLGIALFKLDTIKNIRDYTLGTKPFSTMVLIATTLATAISIWAIMGKIEKVYELGLVFMVSTFFTSISWFILARIFAPNLQMFHLHKFISLSDIMNYWYGKTGRWVTNIISVFVSISVTAMSAIAIGYLLNYFLKIPENTGMIIGLIVVTGYSVFGGIAAVAFTDVFQFLIFFIALPIACVIGYQDIEDIGKMWSSLPKTHTQISTENIFLLISFIFWASVPYTAIPYIQRALMAKDKRQFLQTFIGVGILTIPLMVIVCLIGLITYYNNPDMKSSEVLYHFVDNYLPIGMKGLMISGLLAVIMSTQDSYLNTTSVLISHDICKQIWSSITDKQELLIARISCIAIAIASVSIILINKNIMGIVWLSGNFLAPLISIPLLAGLLGIYINKGSFIFVVISSLTTIITTRFITGTFDTRSSTIGIITSMIALYILHKKYKKERIFSFPKIDITSQFYRLNNRVLSNSYSIGSLYTVGIVLNINLICGLICTNLSYIHILNGSLAITAFLFLMLLLNELWNAYLRRYISDVWRFCLIIGLIFIPSYILFTNKFHIFWLCNFILSAILYIMISDIVIGLSFISIAGLVGYLLSKIFIYKVNLIDETFSYISCGTTIVTIIVQFYRKHFITKSAHEEIMQELKNVMKETVTESLSVKEEFLNKLNHELRIPLSVMINTSDGIYEMWDRLSDKDKKKYLKDIVENRERFEYYTSDILDLASLKQHKFELDIKTNVDLVKLTRDAIDEAQSLIIKHNKNLKIKLELKDKKPVKISCDEKRIKQILHNLLANAIKYSNDGIVKLCIDATEDKIEISVSDQGVGIPDNEKMKIFEPFYEGSRTKNPAEGKGLGLSVAQQIAILHKGYITVKDNKPHGAIFIFLLPCEIALNSNNNMVSQHYDLAA